MEKSFSSSVLRYIKVSIFPNDERPFPTTHTHRLFRLLGLFVLNAAALLLKWVVGKFVLSPRRD